MKYAIVQHSGYVRTAHHEFARAVESTSVSPAQARKVTAAGGLVFPDYQAAESACEGINYPPGVNGLLARARGTFHPTAAVDDLPVYLPAAGDIEVGA